MKLESCQKSGRNLDVFLAVGNFWGRTFQKLYTRYHPCLAARRSPAAIDPVNVPAKFEVRSLTCS